MSIKLDLSKFKHVSSDDKSTTLEHKDGHRLCLAHGGLSDANRAQLQALAKASMPGDKVSKAESKQATQGSVKMEAEGGIIDKAMNYLDSAADSNEAKPFSQQGKQPERKAPAPDPEKVHKYGFDQLAEGGQPRKMYADPTDVVNASDESVPSYTPSEDPKIESKMALENALQFDPQKETHGATQEDIYKGFEDTAAPLGKMFPEMAKDYALTMAEQSKNRSENAAEDKVSQLQAENAKRSAAGLAPVAGEPQGMPVYNKDAQGNPIYQAPQVNQAGADQIVPLKPLPSREQMDSDFNNPGW